MVIPFALLFFSIGYLFFKSKDEVYLVEEESVREKEEMYRGLNDLYI